METPALDLVAMTEMVEWWERQVRGAHQVRTLLTALTTSEARLGDITRQCAELVTRQELMATDLAAAEQGLHDLRQTIRVTRVQWQQEQQTHAAEVREAQRQATQAHKAWQAQAEREQEMILSGYNDRIAALRQEKEGLEQAIVALRAEREAFLARVAQV